MFLDHVKLPCIVNPCDARFSMRAWSELYQSRPNDKFVSSTSVNCGKGNNNCCTVVVGPFNVVPGSSPANGFVTFALSPIPIPVNWLAVTWLIDFPATPRGNVTGTLCPRLPLYSM